MTAKQIAELIKKPQYQQITLLEIEQEIKEYAKNKCIKMRENCIDRCYKNDCKNAIIFVSTTDFLEFD